MRKLEITLLAFLSIFILSCEKSKECDVLQQNVYTSYENMVLVYETFTTNSSVDRSYREVSLEEFDFNINKYESMCKGDISLDEPRVGGSTIIDGPPPVDTDDIRDKMNNTIWVLTKFYDGYAYDYPNDTIRFGLNTYELNNDGINRQYNISGGLGNTTYQLTLHDFSPFGSGTYNGQVNRFFIEDGEINNVEFTKELTSSNTRIKAWFEKIN